MIRVLEGQLKLTYLDPASEVIVRGGAPAPVLPDQPHLVEPIGKMRMQVDFYDRDPAVATQRASACGNGAKPIE